MKTRSTSGIAKWLYGMRTYSKMCRSRVVQCRLQNYQNTKPTITFEPSQANQSLPVISVLMQSEHMLRTVKSSLSHQNIKVEPPSLPYAAHAHPSTSTSASKTHNIKQPHCPLRLYALFVPPIPSSPSPSSQSSSPQHCHTLHHCTIKPLHRYNLFIAMAG